MPSLQELEGSSVDLMPFLKRLAAAPSDAPAVPLEKGLQELRDSREVADFQREADSLAWWGRLPVQELNRFAGKAERAIARLADYAEMLPHSGREEPRAQRFSKREIRNHQKSFIVPLKLFQSI